MKAWVLHEPGELTADGPLRLEDRPRPEAGDGEVLIEVEVCGLCRTDLHILQGEMEAASLPIVPGHQVVGRVLEDAEGFSAGDRVGVAWLHATCGACPACLGGRENLCQDATYTGYHVDGGFAEVMKARAAFAYRLPDGVDAVQAAPLLCAGIIGYRALQQTDLEDGEAVGLYGFGSSAHIALQVAQHRGCRVHVVTRDEGHQELARELGAVWVGGADDRPPEPLDRAVIFAPAGEVIPKALEATRWGGTVVSAAIYMTPIPELDYTKHVFGERTLRSTTANTREDGRALLDLAAEGVVETHVTEFGFEDVHEGLGRILDDAIRGSAVLRVR